MPKKRSASSEVANGSLDRDAMYIMVSVYELFHEHDKLLFAKGPK